MTIYLTDHFTFEELTDSDYATRKGIDNSPTDDEVRQNLQLLAEKLERVRYILAVPMVIKSGYRCPKLNSSIGGASNSYHLKGLAADFIAPGFGNPEEICRKLIGYSQELDWDQLICEGTWVHIGFSDVDEIPRRDVLTAHFQSGSVFYTKGLA